ncbi:hypothetical protein PXK30_09430 [Phaeobacter gallaeciensis]|uniref:hypothetical protein n=1 Tax=Phaeobacter gallaeciensis TaxID=60890 RepID=UPI00237F8578|nr:hypothetical protein [Phaeobacter gallaeciensis]MDE4303657.1 hypothetical protein [Phaeobacter gallaeciensis]MDE4307862.1 hypothetical protein [Phaeobacter gallaeciensis]MDE4312320.1 hypothetical protein [Phaeobacter gallaeciensis]MDE4316791.1 hypothetical protein [Phaeobacter gallaeciensis]MDE4321254.1 hypothetical protein [Phaeobacter gallaeciensis]
MTVWCFVETFQTLIAGGLGFGGVILTILASAKSTRQQEADRLKQRAASLSSALREELEIIVSVLERNAEAFSNISTDSDNGFFVPIDELNSVYRANLASLAELPPGDVKLIVEANLKLAGYERRMGLASAPERGVVGYIWISDRKAGHVAIMTRNLAGSLRECIDKLSAQDDAN